MSPPGGLTKSLFEINIRARSQGGFLVHVLYNLKLNAPRTSTRVLLYHAPCASTSDYYYCNTVRVLVPGMFSRNIHMIRALPHIELSGL